MATTKVLAQRATHGWHAPTAKVPTDAIHTILAVALWVVLLSLLTLGIAGAVSWVFTTYGDTAYLRGEGVGSSVPLGALATFMTITMLPQFMPLLLPLVAVVLLLVLPFPTPAKDGYTRLK